MHKAFLLFLALFLPALADASPFQRANISSETKQSLGLLAVQANGRVKPIDTLAHEGVTLLTGKSSYRGLSAIEILFSILAEPKAWQNEPFIQIRHLALKKDLGFIDAKGSEKNSMFTLQQVQSNKKLMPLFSELEALIQAGEKLDPYFQAVQRLGNQLNFLNLLISGKALRLVPPQKGNNWVSLADVGNELQIRFTLIAATFVNADPVQRERIKVHAENFRQLAKRQNTILYPSSTALKVEYYFNHWRPFRLAWIISLFAIVAISFALFSKWPVWYWSGISLAMFSMAAQIIGFAMRAYIAGRPPVTNMYESVIWVAAGTLVFGLFFELRTKKVIFAFGALLFNFIGLLIADNITSILDDSIHPLEPVLRSNFWLLVHVLTITLSYAAFSLSLILANLGILPYLVIGRESEKFSINLMAQYSYRGIQIGIILLAAGTILGGVWADYSWGRFWGWDPKETWALIALLGYLALIHARFRGMVRAYGFLNWNIVAYLGVIMAWYGVNFVLGAGLHTYGFSSGGLSGVTTYVLVQLLILLAAMFMRRRLLSK